MTRAPWLSSADLASLAGIRRQNVLKALTRTISNPDYLWRGVRLEVCERHGRGGRSGKQHWVRVDSLPPNLQLACKNLQAPLDGRLKLDAAASAERERRFTIIRPALACERYTAERAEAVRQIADREHLTSSGTAERLSERTLHRWIERYEARGPAALTRRRRSDAGASKALISRAWDGGVSLDQATRQRIADAVAGRLRDLWGRGLSYIDVRRLASERLADLTHQAGFTGTSAELAAISTLPKAAVEAFRPYRRVHEFETHRKAFEDRRPRIVQTTAGFAPMQLVFADIHHMDVLVRREDGSTATPKMICWLDAGTRRVRADLVLCEAGKAVRNADVIQSFINMACDPHWGMPALLYLDNGSEFLFADFAADALKLAGLDCRAFDRKSPIIRAGAYNGPAKGLIEGFFGNAERTIFATLQGYIGGNRMKAGSANVGRPQEPFDGSFEEFRDRVEGLLHYYNTREQTGQLKGRSPQQLYNRALQEGWQRTDVDPDALSVAFSVEDTRKVSDGKISVDGRLYYCKELFRYEGEKVRIRKPKYIGWNGIPFYGKRGDYIGLALPDEPRPYLSAEGAEEAAQRRKDARETIAEMRADVHHIDVGAELAASGQRAEGVRPPPSAGVVYLNPRDRETSRALKEAPEDRIDREHRERQDAQRKRIALLKRHGFPGNLS